MSTTTDRPSHGAIVYRDRRLKATLTILIVWGLVSLLHWHPQTQWLMGVLSIILGIQSLRILLAKPIDLVMENKADLPKVSILVPAKNESAVLSDLVENLFALNYPRDRLEFWIVNDGSTDETAQILSQLQTQFMGLNVHQRASKGGKSGALNSVLPLTQGEIILICDADALLPADFLQQTIPLFQKNAIAALQVRKTIANIKTNFLTHCQQMEMSCDCFLQTHRLAVGGMTELRGNGMLVRRQSLELCNGWSEDSVTDDLDLTFKLYLANADIQFVGIPAIQEEGVTTWKQLWHQRCRWAEGGYQRYLDYFPQIFTLGWAKEIDLFLFFILQFILPIGLIPDLIWTFFYRDRPVLLPLQTLLSILLSFSIIAGLYQFQKLRGWSLILSTIQGSVYMIHWIPVMIVTTFYLCIKPQKLEWFKTEHRGRTS